MLTDNNYPANSLAVDTVLSCIAALNKHDYEEARTYVTDDMVFVGVLGAFDGGDKYTDYIKTKRITYDIHKVFVDGDDVCLLYDLKIAGTPVYGCGWYHTKEGKITMLRVVFDPRAILENKEGK